MGLLEVGGVVLGDRLGAGVDVGVDGLAGGRLVGGLDAGLDTAAGPGWTVDEIAPAVDVALEAFGAGRLMFGSDWPVCRLVSTYPQVVGAIDSLIADLSLGEQTAIMGGTAAVTYRLDDVAG